MSKAKKPTIDADFQLKIGDRQVPISVAVPDYDVAAVELIPVYQAITDKVVSNNAQESEANGKAISCRAGCGSCCNQMVPVTLLEAEHLSKVVKRMPEPKQSRVRQRFKAIEEKMQTTGLAQEMAIIAEYDAQRQRELAIAYFKMGEACPFLESQSCSIYPDRPLECREFLVTSDPKHCEALDAGQIQHIDSKLRLLPALRKQSESSVKVKTASWMIMPLSLDWVKSKRHRYQRRNGRQWLKEFIDLAVKF